MAVLSFTSSHVLLVFSLVFVCLAFYGADAYGEYTPTATPSYQKPAVPYVSVPKPTYVPKPTVQKPEVPYVGVPKPTYVPKPTAPYATVPKPAYIPKPTYGKKPAVPYVTAPKPTYVLKPTYGKKPAVPYVTAPKPAYLPKPYVKKPAVPYVTVPKPAYVPKPTYVKKPAVPYVTAPKPTYVPKPTYGKKPAVPYVTAPKPTYVPKPTYGKKAAVPYVTAPKPAYVQKPSPSTTYGRKLKEYVAPKPDNSSILIPKTVPYVALPKPSPKPEPYSVKSVTYTTQGIQGLIYCKSGEKLTPLEGAVARVTCLAEDAYGNPAPFSSLSPETNDKGYFLAVLPLKVKGSLKLTKCKTFLYSSPSQTCNIPIAITKGLYRVPSSCKVIPELKMKLCSVGPFAYTTPTAAKPHGRHY